MAENETERVEVYRLRVAKGNQGGGGSGGDWSLYESREDFELATLQALIEAHAHTQGPSRRDDSVWRACRTWLREVVRGGSEDHEGSRGAWTVSRVVAAEQLVDGAWVDLKPSLVPPSVRWTTPPAPESATPFPIVAEAQGMATMSDSSESAVAEVRDNWRFFKAHVPVGEYLPVGQLDGDCRECHTSWPCAPYLEALAPLIAERVRAAVTEDRVAVIKEHAETFGVACSTSRDWLRDRADRRAER